MLFAYIDESGDSGYPKGSKTYALGCVLVDASRWPWSFDQFIEFRRYLRNQFGVPVRAEIKANYLLHNGGDLRGLGLSEPARFRIYRSHMRLHAKLGFRTFAVVSDKAAATTKYPGRSIDEICWEYLLQRLERTSDKEDEPILVVHDEGDAKAVRGRARRSRRAGIAGSAFGTGVLNRPFRLLLDDPVPRQSTQSYFVQLADLAAYAAFRRFYPPPPRTTQIVPQAMWDELGSAAHTKVSRWGPGAGTGMSATAEY